METILTIATRRVPEPRGRKRVMCVRCKRVTVSLFYKDYATKTDGNHSYKLVRVGFVCKHCDILYLKKNVF